MLSIKVLEAFCQNLDHHHRAYNLLSSVVGMMQAMLAA